MTANELVNKINKGYEQAVREATFAGAHGCAALVRRIGWHNWQEAATLIKTTKNGWRIRWETGYRAGKTCNLTKRNWVVKQHNNHSAQTR